MKDLLETLWDLFLYVMQIVFAGAVVLWILWLVN